MPLALVRKYLTNRNIPKLRQRIRVILLVILSQSSDCFPMGFNTFSFGVSVVFLNLFRTRSDFYALNSIQNMKSNSKRAVSYKCDTVYSLYFMEKSVGVAVN